MYLNDAKVSIISEMEPDRCHKYTTFLNVSKINYILSVKKTHFCLDIIKNRFIFATRKLIVLLTLYVLSEFYCLFFVIIWNYN